jgi:hypothetical protein
MSKFPSYPFGPLQPIDTNSLTTTNLGTFRSTPYGTDAQKTGSLFKHSAINKKVINLTPYTFSLVNNKGYTIHVFPRYGIIASVIVSTSEVDDLFGQPIIKTEFKGINNLPDPEEGVYYLVSREVAEKAKRRDVICADTDTAIYENGELIAIRNFKTFG